MLNLEWLRTFRAVYRSKSLSRASEILKISQPTVSQQIVALEARVGKKLFTRKSKGVIETDAGKMLNTMISGSIEELEGVEFEVIKSDSKIKNILSLGISEHLYKTTLCDQIMNLGEYVHLTFADKGTLIRDVNEGNLLYAIIPDKIENFDSICFPIKKQKIVLVGTPDIDFSILKKEYAKNSTKAQEWLKEQTWYAHDNNSNFIKIYWLTVFDKKRPSIIPNYIIPNEYEVLFQQSKGSGLSVAFDTTVKPFTENGTLKTCELKHVEYRELSLIANKKKTKPQLTEKILKAVKS